MTAQILTLESSGRHNAGFDASRVRILEGATWKHQRVIKMMPAAKMISTKVALSHECLMFPPNNAAYRMLCLGMEVGDAYSQAIEGVLADPTLSTWEYILTLEHDNMPPQDGLLKLLARMDAHPELAAISGVYWTKGPGGVCQRWGDVNDPVLNFRPQPPPPPGELGPCNGIGMGFALWRIATFRDEKLRRPWFKTIAGTEGIGTQDLYFWTDARKYGYRCAVDGNVLVGHYSVEEDFVW